MSEQMLPKELLEAANAAPLIMPTEESVGELNWLTYDLSPSVGYGQRLGRGGGELRASRILVYAPYVHWSFRNGEPGTLITSPKGLGLPTPGFSFPEFNPYSICLYHGQRVRHMIAGSNAAEASDILLSPNYPILVIVNDGTRDYFDNVGSFRIHVQVVN